MILDISYVHAAFAVMTTVLFLIIVPKLLYKQFLIYGIIFGGLVDALMVSAYTVLGLIRYKGFGLFGILDLVSSWTPVVWISAFGMFFYMLPVRKFFLIPYILSWTAFTYGIGLVFENFGVFEYIGLWRYIAPLNFLAWFSVSAWFYTRNSKVSVALLGVTTPL